MSNYAEDILLIQKIMHRIRKRDAAKLVKFMIKKNYTTNEIAKELNMTRQNLWDIYGDELRSAQQV